MLEFSAQRRLQLSIRFFEFRLFSLLNCVLRFCKFQFQHRETPGFDRQALKFLDLVTFFRPSSRERARPALLPHLCLFVPNRSSHLTKTSRRRAPNLVHLSIHLHASNHMSLHIRAHKVYNFLPSKCTHLLVAQRATLNLYMCSCMSSLKFAVVEYKD